MFWREGSKNCWCALPLADLEPQAVFLLAHLMVNPKSLLLTLILLWCSDTPLEKSSFRKWRHSWKVYSTTKMLRRLQQDASCLPHIPTCGIPNHCIQRGCSNARGTEHVLAHSSPSCPSNGVQLVGQHLRWSFHAASSQLSFQIAI